MLTTTDTTESPITKPKTVATSGEIFGDGHFLELVNTSTGRISLLHWDGLKSDVARQHHIGSRRYIAAASAADLQFLPSAPEPYGTTEELFMRVSDFLAETLALPGDDLSLLVCFCFASYFCDCLALAPCLLLQGPSAVDAIFVLRALASVSRHPLMLAKSAISTLTKKLSPTRLVCQSDAEFEKMLPSILFQQFGFPNGGIRHVRGACAVYIGDEDLENQFCEFVPLGCYTSTMFTASKRTSAGYCEHLTERIADVSAPEFLLGKGRCL